MLRLELCLTNFNQPIGRQIVKNLSVIGHRIWLSRPFASLIARLREDSFSVFSLNKPRKMADSGKNILLFACLQLLSRSFDQCGFWYVFSGLAIDNLKDLDYNYQTAICWTDAWLVFWSQTSFLGYGLCFFACLFDLLLCLFSATVVLMPYAAFYLGWFGSFPGCVRWQYSLLVIFVRTGFAPFLRRFSLNIQNKTPCPFLRDILRWILVKIYHLRLLCGEKINLTIFIHKT